MKNPNPQGKGLVPVLEHWHALQPRAVAGKPAGELLVDYFASALVLSARFAFKPVVGRAYFLYWSGHRWQLSLISPNEWGSRAPGACVGECRLRADMTWRITPGEQLADDTRLQSALADFLAGFIATVSGATSLEQTLPGYVADLPYYQRLLATGLTSSVRQSLQHSGLANIPCTQWLSSQGVASEGARSLLSYSGTR